MKKILALLMALIAVASLAVGCKPADEGAVIDVTDPVPTPATDGQAGASLSLSAQAPSGAGAVAAGAIHSVGVRADGTLIAAGRNADGQMTVSSWKDVIYADATDSLTVGLTAAGTALVAGANAPDVSSWSELEFVQAGTSHVVGLKADGTVVAAGDNSKGQCDVSSWSSIVSIAAAGNYTIGLRSDGTLVAAGDNANGQCDVAGISGATAISAATTYVAALTSDGAVVTAGAVPSGADAGALSGLSAIAAGDSMIVGLKADGTVAATPDDARASQYSDVAAISAGAVHAIVMMNDGSVGWLGVDSDFQCEVDSWQLRPYKDGEYYKGFGENMSAGRIARVMSAITGAEVTLNAAGAVLADTAVAGTGAEINSGGAPYGVIVVMGDVNGDGIINAADAEAVSKHNDGSAPLTGAFLAAADVKTDAEGKITESLRAEIEEYAAGNTDAISQYPKAAGKYDAKIAEAKKTAKTPDDVIGWINIDGTNIDHPIMYDPNGFFYNDHTPDGASTESGSIYSYYNNLRKNFLCITGHNSRISGTMFHELHHIQAFNLGKTVCDGDEEGRCTDALTPELPDFKTYKGSIWTIAINGAEHKYQIFSMYETGPQSEEYFMKNIVWPGHELETSESIQSWINTQLENSEYDFGAKPGTDAKFLCMTVCGAGHDDSVNFARLYYFLYQID